MGWVAIATAVLQGVQAIRGYNAQRSAEKAQKAQNAAIMAQAEEEARLTKADAAVQAQKARDDAAKVRSQQLALYLKSGVTLDGSPMLVLNDTTSKGEENANNITANADSQAKSILLRGKAGQQPVTRADFFGTAADVLGSASKAKTAYTTAYGS